MKALRLVGASMLAACCFGAEPRILLLLPEGFRGWACVDLGVKQAPPLPREGDALVVRIRKGEVLRTSDKPAGTLHYPEAWFEGNGQRRPLPEDVQLSGSWVHTDPGGPVERNCFFLGTEEERDLAGQPPGFGPRPPDRGVSREERQALVALYEATDGSHWKHRTRWLEPPGTECQWYGVACQGQPEGRVVALDLGHNNLGGTVPEALGRLKHLDSLTLSGNRLSGRLPGPVLQRWLAGTLDLSAEQPLLTDVSEIEFESDPSELLCGWHRFLIRSDGRATLFTTRCRNATPEDRATFCEVKEGHTYGIAILGWLLEKNGFYNLKAEYSRNITGSVFETIRVTRNGKRHEVGDYAGGGPFELWVIQIAIEGIASQADWEKTTTLPVCPVRKHIE